VTPANVTKAYGAAIPALPASVTGAVNGDLFLASDTTTATPASPVGSYPITPTLMGVGLSNLNNYLATYNIGTLTIAPVPLTVTVASATRVYGAANPTLTGTVSGAVDGDTFTVVYSTTATPASGVGGYSITATVTGANIGNYTVNVVPGTLTVTPAPLTVTVADATRAYGAANPVFTAIIAGAINGDTFTNNFSTTATQASPVGTYPIADVLSGPAAANYSVTAVPGTLTVTQATTVLNIAANHATRLYGAANPAFTSTVTGALNGDTFTITYATSATPASAVGSYAIVPTVTGAALANYATVTTTNGTLAVTGAPLSVSVANATRVYGAANPAFSSTVAGLANGDTVAIAYSTAATPASPVGAYPITATVSGAAASNYSVTAVPGTLTITPAPLTVTVANGTRAYGSPNPGFTSTVTGALNGDTFTNTYSTTATPASPVGTYPIADVLSGPAAANYSVTMVPGMLTVTAATAVLNIAANNATRLYGAANPTFTGTITGALNGDTFTIVYASTATATSPVGAYPIVPAVSGAALSNYTFSTADGTLTVAPAPLAVTAANAARAYGAANPAFTGTVTGLANGDTVAVTYATTAIVASPAGAYPIVPTVSGAALSNYTLATANGILTVTTAAVPLSVTVNNATRAYGAANPAFTSTVTGLLNGDTVTVNYTTTATLASSTGTYPIAATVSGAAAANYTANVVPGRLSVTPAATATTLVASASAIIAGASVTFTATVTSPGGIPAGNLELFSGTIPIGTTVLDPYGVATFSTSSFAAGSYNITALYEGSANFQSSSSTVTEAVSAGSFTVAANPPSQFIRGPGSTVYTIAASSVAHFAGAVALSCSGLPVDATCAFSTPTLNLTDGATATTTLTIVDTAADAQLRGPTIRIPGFRTPTGLAPIAIAAVFPFELTGLAACFASLLRRKRGARRSHPAASRARRSPKARLGLALLATAAVLSLGGCACFTSIFQTYTVTITGTSPVYGTTPQSTTVSISVAQQ